MDTSSQNLMRFVFRKFKKKVKISKTHPHAKCKKDKHFYQGIDLKERL